MMGKLDEDLCTVAKLFVEREMSHKNFAEKIIL